MDMASVDWAGLSDDNRRGRLMVGGETDESMAKIGQGPLINQTLFLNSLANWHSLDVSSIPIGVSCSVGVSSAVVSTMVSTDAMSDPVSCRDISTLVKSSKATEVVKIFKMVLGRDEVLVDSYRSADKDWATMVYHW
ncbi:hypothetical protein JTE90_002069 [Oedothorax gibbosus]|uniref:Uncharacterized protein n=1 Tax=Oedothorax gibbosus TaxID=931172 RepID=A0AAV6UDP7_9ARAC|nr:hypothetical protein JTE90_002069 [Oedothorax gibbosus]